MKKNIIVVVTLLLITNLFAQVNIPNPSPNCKLYQTVGLTEIYLEYSRPGKKGRIIFGDLVPFGKIWRAGANANTKITFGDDVMIGETFVKRGSYAIFVKPFAEKWEVIFYEDTDNWGIPKNWNETKVVAKVTVPVKTLPYITESFTIRIENLSNDGADLTFNWGNAYVVVHFEVPTERKVIASIEKSISGSNASDYFSAARYYFEKRKELDKAKIWIDKAVEMTKDQPRFWYLREQSLIYASIGKKEEAVKIAMKSLEFAESAGNSEYAMLNKKSILEWKEAAEIYCCSNHKVKHCDNADELKKLSKKFGCKGFN